MKKVSLITILMFFVLICPLTVGAVNIIYTTSGIFDASHPDIEYYDQKPDPFGYDQKPFFLEFTIDSMKPPSDFGENSAFYVADRVSFSIDGQAQIIYGPELSDPELRFAKCSDCFGGVGVDSITLIADFYPSTTWEEGEPQRIQIGMHLDYCTLGADYPIPPLESIKFSDPSVRSAAGDIYWAWSLRGTYLTVIDNFNARAVPEPTTMLLLGTGLIGLAGFGRKRFKK